MFLCTANLEIISLTLIHKHPWVETQYFWIHIPGNKPLKSKLLAQVFTWSPGNRACKPGWALGPFGEARYGNFLLDDLKA